MQRSAFAALLGVAMVLVCLESALAQSSSGTIPGTATGALSAHEVTHRENGSDELLIENLGTTCGANLIPKADGAGGIDCAADDTGSSPSFDAITTGTNTTATLTCGTGCSIGASGSGAITATSAASATTATTAEAGDSATAFFSSGTIEDARLPTGLARDSEATEACQSGGISSPDNTDRIVPGMPFAVTITRLRCHAEGTTPSITFALDECDNTGASCVNGGLSVTCDGGIDEDTTFTDAAFDADDAWQIDLGAASGTVTYLSWTVCYDRQVVQ